jgi:hypothetical protein
MDAALRGRPVARRRIGLVVPRRVPRPHAEASAASPRGSLEPPDLCGPRPAEERTPNQTESYKQVRFDNRGRCVWPLSEASDTFDRFRDVPVVRAADTHPGLSTA